MKLSKIDSHWDNHPSKSVDLRRLLPPWHEAFLLAPNVRFTRTPENELNRHHNHSPSHDSKATENHTFSEGLNKKLTDEHLNSTSSLAHLKTQLMMNRDSVGKKLQNKKKSHPFHIVKYDSPDAHFNTQKENILSSTANIKTTHQITNITQNVTFSWLSDSAFFEGFASYNPLTSFTNQVNILSKSSNIPSNNSEHENVISKIFKTPKYRQGEESATTHAPIIPLKNNFIDQETIYSKETSSKNSLVCEKIEKSYEPPCSSFLQEKPHIPFQKENQEYIEKRAQLLEDVLTDFGIQGEIININPGPVVTLYEFEPAPGTKSSRIIGLADDIARSMSSLSARVAVIPKRNAIGIELPNDAREIVYLRQIIASRNFSHTKADLALCLGKTIGGESVIADLAKMPHILVAGTTGSGKSVAINTMIMSLLYRLRPEECRMIMVDPKMLELSVYDGIPHLLTPVVTDPKKAVIALKWAVSEMEERYRKMSKLSVRNIKSYNERIATINREKTSPFDEGEKSTKGSCDDMHPIPYIVIIVDEMADLMMVAGKEIEGAIQRLAQMARAAGIHLIMATQRPSVDVITGTIKANFPIRISFQVTSKIDSRTILGEHGAEQLLGQGDMLYMSGGGRIQRVHGPLVSDIEIEKVVKYLKTQGHPKYLHTVTTEKDRAHCQNNPNKTKERDSLYEQAIHLVITNKKCSTSFIQRHLQIGYNRAALLVERMEQEELISESDHVGKRHIFPERLLKYSDEI
ncbi:MAG: DNA translocase FtsK [Candidatus Liberibacter ctenarytainae]|uniref:DNA translocase FtsK n=1 Tax=Candidatus Liberibacter ctenarytainae TaxID=2020335 RepID=A0A937ARV1_9HYPH|nr:DNA translocase FtsK [Candidatus Liberibacter ctenarytainae]